jgi:hypothetical protein
MFGSSDGPYLQLPQGTLPAEITVQWIKTLDANLKSIRDKSSIYQNELIEKRISKTPIEKQNVYHPGELVLWQRDPTKPLPNKLASHFKGPYEVIAQYKNDVECRHVVMRNIQTLPVNRLKMFHGRAEEGYHAALHDANQGNIVKIDDWRNTPDERSFIDFLVEFEGRHPEWIPYSKDLDDSQPYGEYVNSQRPFFLLRYPKLIADKARSELNRKVITEVQPKDRVYVDLRKYGACPIHTNYSRRRDPLYKVARQRAEEDIRQLPTMG